MRNIAQPCAICQENLLFALDKESLTATCESRSRFDAMQNALVENKIGVARGFKNSKYDMTINRLYVTRFWLADRRASARTR